MNKAIRLKLFVMMVLQFFIWGAWLPKIFGYLPSLQFSSFEQSLILSAFPAAAIIGLFFSNQFADRNFSAERFLAFSHLVAGISILSLAFVRDFWPFFLLMALHCLLYVPTISITNSIAFAHIKDPQREFGLIRMGGTIGWILAAWPFTFILVDWEKVQSMNPTGFIKWVEAGLGSGLSGEALLQGTKWTFVVAGIASLVLALYSLFLPHTPPKKAQGGVEKLAWLEAVKLLRVPFILVLWIVTLADAFVHGLYFVWTETFLQVIGIPGNWTMPVMSIGQVAEIITMIFLGAVLKKLGWRTTMVVGVLGHTARFMIFALLPDYEMLVVAANVLHGICYAFFFATVYIFVDHVFPKDARASAQGLFNFVILGLGILLANFVGPHLRDEVFITEQVVNYRILFLIPAGIALLAAITLALFFRPPPSADQASEPAPTA